jgi:hypothetical protein
MDDSTLQELVIRFKDDPGDATAKAAVDALSVYLFRHIEKYRLRIRDEDMRCDFIAWMYPRLHGLIERYIPEKASLVTYLSWNVKLSFRSFCRDKLSIESRERVYECEEQTRIMSDMAEREASGLWELYASESEPAMREVADTKPSAKTRSAKQREIEARTLLLLACKSGCHLDESTISMIAERCGMELDYIRAKLDRVRQTNLLYMDNLRKAHELEYRYYLRTKRCRFELERVDERSTRHEALLKERDYCQRRLERIRHKIRRQFKAPSNRYLARELGIRRGTVDSTLASAMRHGYAMRHEAIPGDGKLA